MNEEKIIQQMSIVSVAGNLGLTAFKFAAGILGSSSAMVSDAVHSASDILTTLIAYIGTKTARKSADKKHPYGHDRFECVATILLAILLVLVGLEIGRSAVMIIISGIYPSSPGILPVIAAVVSIAVKEAMFWYTKVNAKKIHSSAFEADAWHHRTDAFSSVGALIGIIGARMGIKWFDPAASIIIAAIITYIGVKIFIDAIGKMTDSACPKEFEKEIFDIISAEPEISSIDLLLTRKFGERIYIDTEIGLPPEMTVAESHRIIEELHDKIEEKYPQVKHIMIHVNPLSDKRYTYENQHEELRNCQQRALNEEHHLHHHSH